ncbi:MAG: DUF2599 domain-containing protein, partial [Mycolicibacter algericus]
MLRSILFAALAAALVVAAPAAADTGFVGRTEWVSYSGGSGLASLRVYPTPAGRAAAARVDA